MYEVLNVIHVVGLQEPLKGVGEAIEEEGGGIANQRGGGGEDRWKSYPASGCQVVGGPLGRLGRVKKHVWYQVLPRGYPFHDVQLGRELNRR